MTSEVDGTKTNEFLRRRKLRLQQVREQSKDIAKRIRQRAKVETLRQVIDLDTKKKKDYLQRQEKLVKKLEEYYALGLENVGSSHKNASEVRLQGADGDKIDVSKQRGREATAELRKKRQQILDKQKELLDRKLLAREVANEISRDKSGTAINKLLQKPSSIGTDELQNKCSVAESDTAGVKKHGDVARNDMATQWDLDEVPNEWEPNIPTLLLPKDDNSVKESNNNNGDSKSDKSKRIDLFAVSEEMPSSLRGGLTNPEERGPVKSSLTLVSEYLQNRDLRLRETDTTRTNKKLEDIQSLKQTILRTRSSKEGTVKGCHVHDDEMVPVPSWRPQYDSCGIYSHDVMLHKNYDKHFTKAYTRNVNKHFSSYEQHSAVLNLPKSDSLKSAHCRVCNTMGTVSHVRPGVHPSPVVRRTSPFRRAKVTSGSPKGDTIDRQFKSSKSTESSANQRKSLVTMYNHNTRDIRDIPNGDDGLVMRNSYGADDAYSQAMKENSAVQLEDKEKHKVQEIRSKVAMTKQNVEKEYRDTILFLNALPKDKGNRPIKTAYMDEQRQQMQKDIRQQKLQQEYRKIEKECKKHNCKKKPQSQSRSPVRSNSDRFETTDLQYSWMPIPENDDLAIHTIPTTFREGKNNTVKFSKVDSYHEYRSRHKHTPPTKETTDQPKIVDPVDSFQSQGSSETDSISSNSSVKSVRLVKKDKTVDKELSDAERIIIYKILDTKSDERKKTSKLMKDIAKSLTRIEQKAKSDGEHKSDAKKSSSNSNAENIVSIQQLDEGVYETVNENGDNIASMYFQNDERQATDGKNVSQTCTICKKHSKQSYKAPAPQQWQDGDEIQTRSRSPRTAECDCGGKTIPPKEKSSITGQQSITTSATSFRTAANDKASNAISESDFVKLVDEGGREAGKFYIGASGLLNNDAYEVVIQLRKKGVEKETSTKKSEDKKDQSLNVDTATVVSATQTETVIENTGKKAESITGASKTEAKDKLLAAELDSPLTDRESRQTILDGVPPQSTDNVESSEPNEPKMSEKTRANDNTHAQNIPEQQTTPAPRPATSTYTQTTLNSPTHRPILLHMSSSTSTAYMSPPEMIFPKFMKGDHRISEEDIYNARETYNLEDIVAEQHQDSEEFNCDCRKCLHARRITMTTRIHASRHRCKSERNAKAPPNSARSVRSEASKHIYSNNEECDIINIEKGSKQVRRASNMHNRDDYNLRTQKKQHLSPKLSSRNFIRIPSSTSSKKGQTNRSKTKLKPIIKNYVDKLLELNKESLKAVQVVEQDCSSVTTPGSSVVNIPNNIDNNKINVENKLSLEKIRDILKHKILNESERNHTNNGPDTQNVKTCYRVQSCRNLKLSKLSRKKAAHKVKSLNISKKVSRMQTSSDSQTVQHIPNNKQFSSLTTRKECVKKQLSSIPGRGKIRSKSSPTPRMPPNSDTTDRSGNSDLPHTKFKIPKYRSKPSKCKSQSTTNTYVNDQKPQALQISGSSNHAMTTTSNDSDRNQSSSKHNNNTEIPMSISTQTSINVDAEVNYIKLAEDKLQNMEKIADLTEKCTKRLSNLAKVLEEVRKNKTLVYSHISSSDANSDCDQKSDKNANNNPPSQEPSNDVSKKSEPSSTDHSKKDNSKEYDNSMISADYIPFLSNISKPAFKSLNSELDSNSSSNSTSPVYDNANQSNKPRGKPPPALSRMHLKHGQDFVVPHELSTVVEVDSPMSIKLRSSRNDTKTDALETSKKDKHHSPKPEFKIGDVNNPDLLNNKVKLGEPEKKPTVLWSDNINSRVEMIDIEEFNEIMLKPFFSVQEYAKQCNVGTLDDGSNLDDILKDDHINDELSSLHSEASLPDVISELLKRNVISEPFKYDSGSNANSTTVSSESTISVLALSRARQGTNKPRTLKIKDNIGETSDTMSISSNPDLENAFKKLGMGWASSTLKKTKERLALSSSSNTSSSSLSQFKVKAFNHDIAEPLTDTVSSILSLPSKVQQRNADNSKNAEQQTSKTNAMTVKEFLTNELAKKITFNSKSKNDSEFASLYETKMPEEMKHSSLMVREEAHSIDNSAASGNRARTSTPVQLYKSMAYHSSSSSNMSNGLFSNADDLSSVKVTSNSMKHSTSDKDDLIIPNLSLRMKKGSSDYSKSD